MKALMSHKAGGPETLVLEDVAEPEPKAGEVLIAIRACGVNYPDVLTIQDLYQTKPPRPFAPGTEIAGIVEFLASPAGAAFTGQSLDPNNGAWMG